MSEQYKTLDPEEGPIATSESHAVHLQKKNRTIRLVLLGVLVVVLVSSLGGFVGGLAVALNNKKHQPATSSMQPKELFVSAGHNASTAVNITWVTENSDAISCGQFGLSPDSLVTHVCGKKQDYTFDSSKFGLFVSPTFHYITLDGLIPNTKYYYSVGDNQAGGTTGSKIYSFRTASIPMQKTAFTIVGDLGQTKYSAQTVRRMKSFKDSEVILHVGDMSYADTNQQRWSSWANMVEPLSATKQWMVVPGNHEIESQASGLCFIPYETRFNMPSLAPPVNYPITELAGCEWWAPGNPYPTGPTCCPSILTGNTYDFGNAFYSFDFASVHVLVLNSYTNSSRASIQYRWAEAELQMAATRADHPWIVVMMHCPFYNSNKHHENEAQAVNMKASMEDLFLQYNVTLVLAGHVHSYERTHRIAHGKLDKKGIYYVTMGDGGNREGHAYPFLDPKPVWSDKRNDTLYGHARVHVENQTHLHWQWLPTPDDPNSELHIADDIWMTRDV